MPTLGERLAQNMETERRAAEDSAAALQLMRTEEARRIFQTAQRFFEHAKSYFTQAIEAGTPTKDICIQVGGSRFARGRDVHQDFDAVLEGYKYQYNDTRRGPDSLFDPKRFASLWTEFQQWASSNGLTAYWVMDHDGGGMEGWWLLKVQPKAS